MRSLAEVHTTEALINQRLSKLGVHVVEHAVVLRTVKQGGRLQDRRGYGVAAVPLDLGPARSW